MTDRHLDENLEVTLRQHASERDMDYVEYYDDGEWHSQLISGDELVASGEGGNPSESRAALLRGLGLDN